MTDLTFTLPLSVLDARLPGWRTGSAEFEFLGESFALSSWTSEQGVIAHLNGVVEYTTVVLVTASAIWLVPRPV